VKDKFKRLVILLFSVQALDKGLFLLYLCSQLREEYPIRLADDIHVVPTTGGKCKSRNILKNRPLNYYLNNETYSIIERPFPLSLVCTFIGQPNDGIRNARHCVAQHAILTEGCVRSYHGQPVGIQLAFE
jgi:hypothetical protein